MASPRYLFAENILVYPHQAIVIRLAEPMFFVRFNFDHRFFSSFEQFNSDIIEKYWIGENRGDPGAILLECFDFIQLHEQEKVRMENLQNEIDN